MEEHLHQLLLHIPHNKFVTCEGCDGRWRLASYEEAVFVQMTDTYFPEGPFLCNNNVVVVPIGFTLWMKEDAHAD
jgi:hypothetical protein